MPTLSAANSDPESFAKLGSKNKTVSAKVDRLQAMGPIQSTQKDQLILRFFA
jgi:hypothetical protein